MKQNLLALTFSIFCYLLIFYPILNKNILLYSGKDASSFHYPSRFYLDEKLKQGEFPFWTEKIYGGFAIYGDLERGYMNPVNVLLVYIFGPILSYKLLHFFTYLFGSYFLYLLLKKLGNTIIGFFAANSIYFFSFFMLYHQQHFNTVMTLYLLPMLIYFTEIFSTTYNKKYILFGSIILAYIFYLGSFQFLLLVLLTQLFWLLSRKLLTYKLLKLLLIEWLIMVTLAIPGLLSMYTLYAASLRTQIENIYIQGSFSPIMLMNVFVPFILGYASNYLGILLSKEYLMHEVYIYTSICASLATLLFYVNNIDPKLKRFISYSFVFFLIFSLLRFIPLLNQNLIPPFSMFRYWPRSISILSFAIAVCVSDLLSSQRIVLNLNFKRFSNTMIVIVFILFIELLNFTRTDSISFVHLIFRDDYKLHASLIAWVFLLTLCLLNIFFYYKKYISTYTFKLVLFALIFVDIFYFGTLVMHGAFKNINEIIPSVTSFGSENQRVIDFDNNINGDNALFNSSWGVLGYSVFVPRSTIESLQKMGINNSRYWDNVSITPEFIDSAANNGIEKIINADSTTYTNINFPLKGKYNLEVLSRGEQSYTLNLQLSTDQLIETYLKYDKNWKIWSSEKPLEAKNIEGYLGFDISSGDKKVNIKYIPTNLYGSYVFLGILLIGDLLLLKRINMP